MNSSAGKGHRFMNTPKGLFADNQRSLYLTLDLLLFSSKIVSVQLVNSCSNIDDTPPVNRCEHPE